MTLPKDRPFSVNRYSALGGWAEYSLVVIIPADSRLFKRADSVLGAIPFRESWRSWNRRVSLRSRSRMISTDHRSPTAPRALQTGHVSGSSNSTESSLLDHIIKCSDLS